MSTSFNAQAFIGIALDVDEIMEIKLVRNCSCEREPEKTMEYCSSCGEKAWCKQQVSKTDVNWVEDFYDENELYSGFKVIKMETCDESDWDFYYINKVIIAAIGVSTDDICYLGEPVAFQPFDDNIKVVKEDMKKILEPQGLWDESKFGLYAVGRT